MKNKILLTAVLAITLIFAGNVYAAVGPNNGQGVGKQVLQQIQVVNEAEDTQIQTETNEQVQNGNSADQAGSNIRTSIQQKLQDGSEAGTQVQNQNQIKNQGEANQIKNIEQERTQKQNKEGSTIAVERRSNVANAVQEMLQVADRNSGIGQQVRIIAQQQNESESTTIQAIEKVQARGKVKTLFFGSDYKNLGTLRSEMVKTRNRLEQLDGLIEKVQNEGDKTELQNQIQTLKQEQQKIEGFLKINETKLSLFGWFIKLFNR